MSANSLLALPVNGALKIMLILSEKHSDAGLVPVKHNASNPTLIDVKVGAITEVEHRGNVFWDVILIFWIKTVGENESVADNSEVLLAKSI